MALLVGKQVGGLGHSNFFFFLLRFYLFLKEMTSPGAVVGCLLKGWTVGEGAVVENYVFYLSVVLEPSLRFLLNKT